AVELSTLQQHIAKARVIGGCGKQPAAARRPGRNHRWIRVVDDLETRSRAGVDLRQTRQLLLRHVERRVLHPERLKDSLTREFRERLAGQLLDEVPLDVDADAVIPARAWLREQRDSR